MKASILVLHFTSGAASTALETSTPNHPFILEA